MNIGKKVAIFVLIVMLAMSFAMDIPGTTTGNYICLDLTEYAE